jgi:hypothetical protein
MKILLFILIISFDCILNSQTNLIDPESGLKVVDTCQLMYNMANMQKIEGTNHSIPYVVANEIMININEIDEKKVNTLYIPKCPKSFELYGNLAALGIIHIKTRQKFEVVKVAELMKKKRIKKYHEPILFALNGYMFSDTSLAISKKAITKVESVKIPSIQKGGFTICFSIWTLTNKEIKQNMAMPKLCRGIRVQ